MVYVFFSQIFDIFVNNAWLLYSRNRELHKEKEKSLKEFWYKIAVALTNKEKPRLGRRPALENSNFPIKKIRREIAPRPYIDIRYNKTDHCPTITKKGRFRHCLNGQTLIICLKCNVRLCLIKWRIVFNSFIINSFQMVHFLKVLYIQSVHQFREHWISRPDFWNKLIFFLRVGGI